jgi:prolyl-tRNA synthetase
MFTLLVKDLYSSYKDLPLSIYQIQWKFRDEPRPRAGLLRGREFLMKDSYSFDVDDAGLQSSYDRHRTAYIRTFDRLGLSYVIVAAMSGAMGGSASEEFLAVADVGEDTYVRCTTCDYAANTEAVRTPAPDAIPYDDAPAAHVEDTPDTPTIETLVALSNDRADLRRDDRPWTAADTLKNVVVKLCTPTVGPSRWPSACRRPRGRPQAPRRAGRPGRGGAVHRDRLRGPSALVRGYIGPQALGRDAKVGRALPRRPAGRRGEPAGSPERTNPAATSTTSSPDATSPPTASSRRRRCWPVTRAPTATGRWRWRAASRWVTSSSSGASTPRHSTSRCSTRTASRSS